MLRTNSCIKPSSDISKYYVRMTTLPIRFQLLRFWKQYLNGKKLIILKKVICLESRMENCSVTKIWNLIRWGKFDLSDLSNVKSNDCSLNEKSKCFYILKISKDNEPIVLAFCSYNLDWSNWLYHLIWHWILEIEKSRAKTKIHSHCM